VSRQWLSLVFVILRGRSCRAGTKHAAVGMESRSIRLCVRDKDRIGSGFAVLI
jgi:hypothetical protein